MSEQTVFDSKEFKAIAKRHAPKGKKSRKEEKIQVAVCKYVKTKYPDVMFRCDIASSINLGARIGGMNTRLRSSRALPDITFFEPRRGYHALCIELKKDRDTLYKKNGEMRDNDHFKEQAEILKRLSDKGHYAVFGCGFDHCVEIIDWYLGE